MPLLLKDRDFGIYVYELPPTAIDGFTGSGRCVAYAIRLANTGEYMVRRTGDQPGSEQIVKTKVRAIQALHDLFEGRFFTST